MIRMPAGRTLVPLAVGMFGILFWWHASGINARKIAAAETRMWRAYYAHDTRTMGLELIGLLRNQFGLTLQEALEVGEPLGRAAMAFGESDNDCEVRVLPHLETAYSALKRITKRSFDAQAVARAELDWWVARRTPGRDGAEEVGHRIAALYAVLYGSERDGFEEAGILRAEAAILRDKGGEDCDWEKVEKLLRQSYAVLLAAL